MKKIGITGGVGAGKSEILSYLRDICRCEIIMTDDLARSLQQPGELCYKPMIEVLGDSVVSPADGHIDRNRVAQLVFNDRELLSRINNIVHPAVYESVTAQMKAAGDSGETDYFFVESAILIEAGYSDILDELWYIYARPDVRVERLSLHRGYSREKSESIIAAQKSDDYFRQHCDVVIDNSGALEDTYRQIDRLIH